ncbi:MAG: hypothetical protein DDG60_14725 [Anaerolineae bacterium]|nr:MAG: hypothetical protein DDG60_14725 [Anaerolineae bacterium]
MPSFVHPEPFILRPAEDLLERRPDLRHAAGQLAHAYASGRIVTDADLQKMGAALWSALPPETAPGFEAALAAAGMNILPVILESPSAAIQALPWETLYHPAYGFLAREARFAFSRRYAPPQAQSAPPRPAPLKILHFTALPDDLNPETERLDVEKEQERVQDAVLPLVAQGQALLETPDDGRLETLKDLLERFQPHVLFLSGHGEFVYDPGGKREPFGIFLFENESGAGRPASEAEIAQALVGRGVQMVVLSACESGKAASDALNNGLARRLAALGVPHVIGMRESVKDRAGIAFADALCRALAEGERPDVALQTARAAMTAPSGGPARRESGWSVAAEQLSGQWCLPMLISPDPGRSLADFALASAFSGSLPRASKQQGKLLFIGRRRELRKYKHRLLTGALNRLLITGAGGHGKTTLARKLARELEARGYRFFEWRAGSPWRDFQAELALALTGEAAKQYDRAAIHFAEQPERLAQTCLGLLDAQYNGKIVLLFDNLEAIQDDQTFRLKDETVQAWLQAACSDKMNFVVLATSRWALPDWNGEHLPLTGMSKGDFLRLAQALTERGQMNPLLLADRARLHAAYKALGHNPRGLERLAAATLTMNPQEQADFITALQQAQAEQRQDMALEETLRRLPPEAYRLLCRLHAYEAPVPREGIIKLGLDLPDPEAAFGSLLAFSLLDVSENHEYETLEYQLEPTLLDYLRDERLTDEDLRLYHAAASLLLWLLAHERNTYPHLALTIQALRRAERHAEADRLTLDILVGKYTLDGRYAELLARWLPPVCNSPDLQTQAEALGQTGKLWIHLGDYDTALDYLQRALVIRQQIGDRDGMTLNNISGIYQARGDYQAALDYLQRALVISQQIGDRAGEGATLNNIGQIYQARGDYDTALDYLQRALVILQQIGDKKGEGATLNNIGQIYQARGDYDTALDYLQRALVIRQQIGDRAGLCATLFNIGHIHAQKGEIRQAVSAWVTVYVIAKQINEYQALQALSNLAPQLGMPAGLEGWERLAQQMQNEEGGMQNGEDGQETEQDGEAQLRGLVRRVKQAVEEKRPETEQLFQALSKMATDGALPPELRALGKVLRDYMAGVRNPDLSGLPEAMRRVVEELRG